MRLSINLRAARNGLIAATLLLLSIYLGSGRLQYFDPALIIYTSASVFATFGVVYRYAVWLQKPPTALYWRKGWHLFLQPGKVLNNTIKLGTLFLQNFVLQVFIERRSYLRWAAHFLLSWGCLLAAAVTFPLVFGWVHFDPAPNNPAMYVAVVMGIPAGRFPIHSLIGWTTFHLLDFSAIAIIIGMILAFRRRMYDTGAQALQSFTMDFLPLFLLFAVSVTGLMLTVSSTWMHGDSYGFLALIHAFSVIVTLFYLPFGKFFHIFQRPANMGVYFYKAAGENGERAFCHRCGDDYASAMHVKDLKLVLTQLGMDYSFDDGTHYQDVCPVCRRKMMAVNQLQSIGGPGYL